MLNSRLFATILASLLVLLQSGCTADPHGNGLNVLLVSVDTLRPDHLGCYGYARDTSPNLDALCRESVVFRQTIAQAPSTLPSHASILTSLLPAQHGAFFADRHALDSSILTLTEVLQAKGYRTAAFTGGGQMEAVWGLNQGFETYESIKNDHFEQIVDKARTWLGRIREESPSSPFFLFLHTYEVHHPYTPDEADLARFVDPKSGGWLGPSVEISELKQLNNRSRPLAPGMLEFIEGAYDAEIRSMDRALGKLLSVLEESGLADSTLVVFTSDHGEEFGEHGWYGWHAHTLYDELLRVPLVVRFPDGLGAGHEISRQVRSLDIAPTVLEAVELAVPEQFGGTGLLRAIRGEKLDRLFAISQQDLSRTQRPAASVRTERWKYYDGRLFDLKADPGEQVNVSNSHWDLIEGFRAVLDETLENARLSGGDPVELDSETRHQLKALGYL